MSLKILEYVRNEIYLDLRFLNVALSALAPKSDRAVQTFATDGTYLCFSAEQAMRVFKQNSKYLDRLYLHTILHCVFSHLWVMPGSNDSGEYRRFWHLACDIAVEYVIDGMNKPCTKRILSGLRQNTYESLRAEKSGVSAARIYRMLWELPEEEIIALEMEFHTDDHRYWPKKTDSEAKQQIASENRKKWDKIARQTRVEQERNGDEQEEGERMLASQLAAERSRRSYRDFLQKFSVLREELHSDPDEFDLNYYTYGLRVYGNLPLIEPMESRESKKIHEFIIVIDTSYSTSGELVKQFLRETANILNQSNSFFADSVIRILQCDNAVQSDTVIRTEAELAQFMEQFELVGGGGTDFRPAFAYVNELREQGYCRNLGGLLYFTDGKGIYPKQRPEYKTAFLFLEEYDDTQVPSWAIRLKLEPEEFMRQE
ncbi:MAG: metallopeptidase [Roseburia sp.]|nr:metallopeptidase [Roseburia sp.]